jgi:hypothetical protein
LPHLAPPRFKSKPSHTGEYGRTQVNTAVNRYSKVLSKRRGIELSPDPFSQFVIGLKPSTSARDPGFA